MRAILVRLAAAVSGFSGPATGGMWVHNGPECLLCPMWAGSDAYMPRAQPFLEFAEVSFTKHVA